MACLEIAVAGPQLSGPIFGGASMAAVQKFLETFKREHEKTVKVLRAFPADKGDFRPHERSNTVRDLAFTFVMEQSLLSRALQDQLKVSGPPKGQPPKPSGDLNATIDQFERDHQELVRLIESGGDKQFSGTAEFPTGPGKIGHWEKMDFAWFMLHDQIHHRGQLTVYLRMLGCKVPAIYGPSSDEPWF
ncbi:MAG: DinB family protein [Gemmatimonadaceae bacterium]